jgi:hypothetical protein
MPSSRLAGCFQIHRPGRQCLDLLVELGEPVAQVDSGIRPASKARR